MFGYSRKSLKEEMRNCILVCSNCHCELHEKEQEKI
jgi:predicted HNH restriction endonuclease